ncbi:FtsP/CotA-like multicopper oxidase with cupredoxin domain [Motilibacter peucedani]|uniref:FtsP/CotA-like multicopper oxidase with cupredoxin domain n=1 Tax=Motilibacter peucedani TaxID=598650 RepID=A0A420XRC1_9ACTN|nr:multicopper oxidase domain-containing protein [Motilibacter peucedani]RKS77380.1 FtsP/CotA-like multicopper oxidase with cupredoxin domain [Motilibacter peucedani]
MTHTRSSFPMSRRSFLGATGLAAATAVGARLVGGEVAQAATSAAAAVTHPRKELHLVGTDGWVSMPADAPADPPFFPDALAPSPFNTYVFGFRDVSGMTASQVAAQRGHAQISAPMMAFDEEDDIYLTLTNLGLSQRPDLFDGHTLHWHGFVNAIPLFDGVPELSLAVPVGRDLTYFYRPHDAGTYMYHCHFEDVEHVQMGMTGMVFVRPKQNKLAVAGNPVGTKYAYNDGDGSTRYDREFAYMITELWSAAHYRDAHIQVNDWTDYDPSFWLLNGRAYPDTLAPTGDPRTSTGRLQYQPISSLVQCNEGERVLLRLSSLGYQNHAMTVDEIDLQIVAKDASLLKGRDGTTNYITTNTVDVGPGESRDVMFTAPAPGEYLLYDRKYSYLDNGGGPGYGGMMTKIVVHPAGQLAKQTNPNT